MNHNRKAVFTGPFEATLPAIATQGQPLSATSLIITAPPQHSITVLSFSPAASLSEGDFREDCFSLLQNRQPQCLGPWQSSPCNSARESVTVYKACGCATRPRIRNQITVAARAWATAPSLTSSRSNCLRSPPAALASRLQQLKERPHCAILLFAGPSAAGVPDQALHLTPQPCL